MCNFSDSSDENFDVILTSQNAIDPNLLVPPDKRKLGIKSDIELDHIRIRIGQRPITHNLSALYKRSNRKLTEDLQVYRNYNIWILIHAVSIIKEGGFQNIKQIGYQVKFLEDPKVTVIDVLPQTRFIKKIGASIDCQTDVQIDGQLSIPKSLTELVDHIEFLSFGGKLTILKKVNVVAQLSFSVISPIVQAVGVGDNSSEWIFQKHEEPLIGDQLMMQTLLVPKHLKKIEFTARVYATISTFNFIPTRLIGDWVDLKSELL